MRLTMISSFCAFSSFPHGIEVLTICAVRVKVPSCREEFLTGCTCWGRSRAPRLGCESTGSSIVPDISGGEARASLESLRLA